MAIDKYYHFANGDYIGEEIDGGVSMNVYANETDWLNARRSWIGGSDAACIIGRNPWKSNVDLWREKTGRKKPADLSDNELVNYGKAAEDHLRELFALDYKPRGLMVHYKPFNIWTNKEYPWAHASLDGWLTLITGGDQFGVLEIKTATINSAAQAEKWRNRIPDNYFCQLLHYMAVTGASYAYLSAQLKYERDGEEIESRTQRYKLTRTPEIDEQIAYLMAKEREFANYIAEDKEPPLILNI